VHVAWLDNFSKFYAIAVQGLSGACAECLWTARGLHRYVGPTVSTALVAGQRGMPLNMFSPQLITLFKQKMAVADGISYAYFKDSVCYKFAVRQVPLKPDVDVVSEPALAAVLSQSRDGLRNFFPMGMLSENIGSNRGLLLILKNLFQAPPKPGHYSFLSVDCNIFLRMLKVRCVFVLMPRININRRLLNVVCLRFIWSWSRHSRLAVCYARHLAPLQAG
jgi:hypothetical protein